MCLFLTSILTLNRKQNWEIVTKMGEGAVLHEFTTDDVTDINKIWSTKPFQHNVICAIDTYCQLQDSFPLLISPPHSPQINKYTNKYIDIAKGEKHKEYRCPKMIELPARNAFRSIRKITKKKQQKTWPYYQVQIPIYMHEYHRFYSMQKRTKKQTGVSILQYHKFQAPVTLQR